MNTNISSEGGNRVIEVAELLPRGPKYPWGIPLLAMLNLCTGLYLIGIRIYGLVQAYSEPGVTVVITDDYKVHLIRYGLMSLAAIGSAIGLLVGTKWGWWLAGFYWVWRICYEVLGPMAAAAIPGLPIDAFARPDSSGPLIGLVLFGLLVAYLYKRNVREHFGLGKLSRTRVVLSQLAIGIATVFAIGIVRAIIADMASLQPHVPDF